MSLTALCFPEIVEEKSVQFTSYTLDYPTMYPLVATKDPTAVQVEVQAAYLAMFPRGNKLFVPQVFGWAIDCFTGRNGEYQPIDAKYHDFEHTMQGTLCMSRLLLGRHRAGAEPRISQHIFELGLLAILLHDTGYLKRRGDAEGTGAKYTAIHVGRSAEFAAELLRSRGFAIAEIKSVQTMIHCTGVDAVVNKLPFQNELERITGYALGTSDLLGQMAAEDYVEKLPILYSEFAEAARFSSDKTKTVGMFSSADDLMRKTPMFWEKYVVRKLEQDFLGMYHFLRQPYPDGPNDYVQRIEANIQRVRDLMADSEAVAN